MSINGAHWHLLVNHFPIIGSLMATIILSYGLLVRNEAVIRLSYGLFVFMSIATLVTNQTGEAAEHYLRSINQLDRQRLHEHEEAADWASISMITAGVVSLLSLLLKSIRQKRFIPVLVLLISLITAGLMINVGRLGGLIMHRELRAESGPAIDTNR